MGEALIVRRGGGGGGSGGSLEYVQTLYPVYNTGTSSALDASATYLVTVSYIYPEEQYGEDLILDEEAVMLESGILKAITPYGSDLISKKIVTFNASTNKIKVADTGMGWEDAKVTIFKVI